MRGARQFARQSGPREPIDELETKFVVNAATTQADDRTFLSFDHSRAGLGWSTPPMQ